MATIKQLSDGGPDGVKLGQSSTDLLGFYGATPVARPSVKAAITDASGGVAAVTNGVLTLTGTYNSTILANAIATVIESVTSIRSALVSVGIVA
jgi:hypothetical protein